MKYKVAALTILLVGILAGCGSSPKLRSISITPNPAASTSSPQGQVSFSETGSMSNNSTRALTSSNGLLWASSNSAVATINSSGVPTCLSSGSVTITATAPDNLNKGSSAPAVSGSSTLSCS
jgi:uncharacterized protein YjdB